MARRGEPLPINQALNRPRAKLGLDLSAWMAIVFVCVTVFLCVMEQAMSVRIPKNCGKPAFTTRMTVSIFSSAYDSLYETIDCNRKASVSGPSRKLSVETSRPTRSSTQ
jgi:hypothetical protein